MILEVTLKTEDGTEVKMEVGDTCRIYVGPYNATLGLRELRALEVAINMAIDELERRKAASKEKA
jgi:hypothetical protein